ncbi:MAG: Unknown protein [uncultured Sulfurovum sp.]|uniref:Uncharacterized protein n=1 Tax=uncultured Sulfurovum sp. TaxID=269237 RepID=A0A6S6TQV3_9BACT|nr:MAG: Unknown protein [uncultured Sulfurovum sp.]
MSIPIVELFVFLLLLLGVVGIYYALKMHYVFAFGLVKNTSLSKEKKQKIEKIKAYVFIFLKVLLFFSLVIVFVFGAKTLYEGDSLKTYVVDLWQQIPEGFWLVLLWTLLRIAILIALMKYFLKFIYKQIDKQKQKTLDKKCYNKENVATFYLRLQNTIKFTVVLGVIYRIIHFFPFLEGVSEIFLWGLVLFFLVASVITVREFISMRHST